MRRTFPTGISWRLNEIIQIALTWCLAHYVFEKPPRLLFGGGLQVTVVFIKEFFSVLTAWCKILITTSHPKFVIFPHQRTTPISVIFSPLNMGRLQISTSCPSPSWFGSWQRNLLWSVYCQVTSPWTSLPPSWYSPSLRTQPLKPSCPWTL